MTSLTVADLADRWGVSTGCIYSRIYRMRQSYPSWTHDALTDIAATLHYAYVRVHGPAGLLHRVGDHPPQMPLWRRVAQSRRIWFETETVIKWEHTTYARAWLARHTEGMTT